MESETKTHKNSAYEMAEDCIALPEDESTLISPVLGAPASRTITGSELLRWLKSNSQRRYRGMPIELSRGRRYERGDRASEADVTSVSVMNAKRVRSTCRQQLEMV